MCLSANCFEDGLECLPVRGSFTSFRSVFPPRPSSFRAGAAVHRFPRGEPQLRRPPVGQRRSDLHHGEGAPRSGGGEEAEAA